MTMSNNPTAMSAVVGEELELAPGKGAGGELVKNLLMPAILAAFATYLLIGILTMRVPEGTMFPGPQFFPAIIAIGLYVFAALLAVSAVKEYRGAASADAAAVLADASGEILLVPEAVEPDQAKRVRVDWGSLAWIVGGFLGFTLALSVLGWIIAAALLFWCVARGFGGRRPIFTLLVGLVTSSLTYILFDMLLGLSLPSGLLGWGF